MNRIKQSISNFLRESVAFTSFTLASDDNVSFPKKVDRFASCISTPQ